MKNIWKYPIEITDYQEIEMPICATVLCVQMQRDKPFIWVSFSDEKSQNGKPIMQRRKFYIFGTGIPYIADGEKYIGTFQQYGGTWVWHLFEGRI